MRIVRRIVSAVLVVALAVVSVPVAALAQESAAPLVAIDAGHAAREVGAAAVVDGRTLEEHDLTLEVAREVGRLLESSGYRVLLTRTDSLALNNAKDVNGDGVVTLADDLQARIDLANGAGAVALVSIHFNSSTSKVLRGIEAYYDPDRPFEGESRRLADALIGGALGRLGQIGVEIPSRGVRPDDALGNGHLYLLGPTGGRIARASAMPGVLIEGMYMSNPVDAALIARQDVRRALAAGYAEGIATFLGPVSGSGPTQARVTGVDGAYLRPAPLLATEPLTLLPAGETVQLEERASGDEIRGLADWWRVDWKGTAGYVFGRLIAPLTGTAAPAPADSAVPRVVVLPSDVPIRLRQAATTRSTIIARVRSGATLEVVESAVGEAVDGVTDRWLKVRHGEIQGWVWAPLVRFEQVTVLSTDGLAARIREEPTQQSPIVARARPGETLQVVEEGTGDAVDGTVDRWLRVRHANKEGWVWAPLVGA